MKLLQTLSCAALLGSAAAAALYDEARDLQIPVQHQQTGSAAQASSSTTDLNDGQMRLKTAISTKGNPYMAGLREHQDTADELDEVPVKIAKAPWDVYWVPSNKGWQSEGGPVKDEGGIEKYKLFDANGWVYQYELNVRFKEYYPQGTYRFCDETNDCYKLLVCTSGDHYINYNSKKPNIVRVEFDGKRC